MEDYKEASASVASGTGFADSQFRNTNMFGSIDPTAEQNMSASHTGDSLFAHSTLRSPPEIDLPQIIGAKGAMKGYPGGFKRKIKLKPARD